MQSLELLCLALFLSVAGCGDGPVTTSQRVDAPPALSRTDALADPREAHGHLPPVSQPRTTGPAAHPGVPVDSCPEEKKARPDRAELALAKARLKAEHSQAPEAPVHVPPPPAEVLERQARFLDAVKQRRFDHLPPEQREAAYSAFKRSLLGE
jgi:hypothetical protein